MTADPVGSIVASVVSVRAGRASVHARPDWDHVRTHEWNTAFWKDEVPGPVRVGTLGLEGDEQADKRHHGGPQMAVLMYSEDHYAHWRTLAGLAEMGPGGFGENLSVRGTDERSVCVGDVLEVGSAQLEVSSPRGPCADISRRWDSEWLLKRVLELRYTGWYLRVLREGTVTCSDEVRLVSRPHAGWTIDKLLEIRSRQPQPRAEQAQAAMLAALAPEWRAMFAARAAQD